MEWNFKCWQEGKKGKHHLWGVADFSEHGLSYEIVSHKSYSLLDRFARRDRWGNIRSEFNIATKRDFDCVYSAALPEIMGLGFVRGLGLFPKPIVGVAHHALPGGRQAGMCVKGMDRIVCLSRRTAQKIVGQFPESRDKLRVIPWGWDIDWCKQLKAGGDLVVSAGKTLRDYDTLCRAVCETKTATRIFCSETQRPTISLPDWVVVEAGASTREAVLEFYLEPWYSRAMVVAIPLQNVDLLTGLSSVLDSMACGKPCIVTRNSHLDIDVEKEGCGIWVNPGDVNGWVRAITFIKSHPDIAIEMGRRGRQLCESYYNIRRFTAELAREILSLKYG